MNDSSANTVPVLRLMLPLWFHGDVGDQLAKLKSHTLQFSTGTALEAWSCEKPPDLFVEELLPHTAAAMFSGAGPRFGYYLRVPSKVTEIPAELAGGGLENPVLNRINGNGLMVSYPKKRGKNSASINRPELPKIILDNIELFLSGFGIGILCVTVRLQSKMPIPITTVQALLYWLSQRESWRTPILRQPQPQDDAERWKKMDDATRRSIPPAPAIDSPLAQRLGSRGGACTLPELCDLLIPASLTASDAAEPAGLHQFLHHTVLHFDNSVSFAGLRPGEGLGPMPLGKEIRKN